MSKLPELSGVTLCIGVVKDNADPAQHGRLQVFIPSIDSIDYEVGDLPWARYCSPFGGTTANFKVGREQHDVTGASSYGLWAIPKNSAQVLCGFLEGDSNVRFWLGCFYLPELNRTMPQSVNTPPITSELDDSGQYPQTELGYMRDNLTEAGLEPGSPHYKTRGGWQRSVSYPANGNHTKLTDDGYAPKPLEPGKADSQIVSLTTPGRHYIAMSDVADECRIRIKTTEGTQILLDDTNERIYISTAKGRNWVEIDEGSGKIYFYTASKLSFHSENDMNFYSDQNINIVAKKRLNLQSEERAVKIQSKLNTELLSTAGNLKLTASRDVHVKTTDGEQGAPVGEAETCNLPPYDGQALGLTRDYEEEGGAGTSRVLITAVDGVDMRSESASLKLTARTSVDISAQAGDLTLQSSSVMNFRALNWLTNFGDSNLVALDYHGTEREQLRVISRRGYSGSAQVATSADSLNGEEIKEKMIVPLHETTGWERDEDEASCPTPRNPKWAK